MSLIATGLGSGVRGPESTVPGPGSGVRSPESHFTYAENNHPARMVGMTPDPGPRTPDEGQSTHA